jgi:tRNA U34 5-carboxymethylaminomethyl modifying enzyme MnmG/GidA
VGPRYCPSIEDKVVKFAEESTPVVLELKGTIQMKFARWLFDVIAR